MYFIPPRTFLLLSTVINHLKMSIWVTEAVNKWLFIFFDLYKYLHYSMRSRASSSVLSHRFVADDFHRIPPSQWASAAEGRAADAVADKQRGRNATWIIPAAVAERAAPPLLPLEASEVSEENMKAWNIPPLPGSVTKRPCPVACGSHNGKLVVRVVGNTDMRRSVGAEVTVPLRFPWLSKVCRGVAAVLSLLWRGDPAHKSSCYGATYCALVCGRIDGSGRSALLVD
jgi:hypothetical protein